MTVEFRNNDRIGVLFCWRCQSMRSADIATCNVYSLTKFTTISSVHSLGWCVIPWNSRQHLLLYCSSLFSSTSVSSFCFFKVDTISFKVVFWHCKSLLTLLTVWSSFFNSSYALLKNSWLLLTYYISFIIIGKVLSVFSWEFWTTSVSLPNSSVSDTTVIFFIDWIAVYFVAWGWTMLVIAA